MLYTRLFSFSADAVAQSRYAECVHTSQEACKRTGDDCLTLMAVHEHNEKYPRSSGAMPYRARKASLLRVPDTV
jgi:hypothetical protein